MVKYWIGAFPLALIVTLLFSSLAGGHGPSLPAANHATRGEALSFLRVINLAEDEYRTRKGTFAMWSELKSSNEFLDAKKTVTLSEARFAQTHLEEQIDTMTGWDLRLRVTPDGKGYDIVLLDTTDHTCAFALFTDERFFIWEGNAVGCVN